jgi:hypothetical protein
LLSARNGAFEVHAADAAAAAMRAAANSADLGPSVVTGWDE